MPRQVKRVNLEDWYTAEEAAKKLSENAGRPIDINYPRSLARYGKVESITVGTGKLYLKRDIDAYVVDTKRGPKSKREKQAA